MKKVIADAQSGVIRRVIEVPDDRSAILNTGGDEVAVEALSNESDDTHYVDLSGDEPVLMDRVEIDPLMNDELTGEVHLDGLPIPCWIEWEDQSVEVLDGQAVVRFDEPGTYTLRMSSPPQYKPITLEVTVS